VGGHQYTREWLFFLLTGPAAGFLLLGKCGFRLKSPLAGLNVRARLVRTRVRTKVRLHTVLAVGRADTQAPHGARGHSKRRRAR